MSNSFYPKIRSLPVDIDVDKSSDCFYNYIHSLTEPNHIIFHNEYIIVTFITGQCLYFKQNKNIENEEYTIQFTEKSHDYCNTNLLKPIINGCQKSSLDIDYSIYGTYPMKCESDSNIEKTFLFTKNVDFIENTYVSKMSFHLQTLNKITTLCSYTNRLCISSPYIRRSTDSEHFIYHIQCGQTEDGFMNDFTIDDCKLVKIIVKDENNILDYRVVEYPLDFPFSDVVNICDFYSDKQKILVGDFGSIVCMSLENCKIDFIISSVNIDNVPKIKSFTKFTCTKEHIVVIVVSEETEYDGYGSSHFVFYYNFNGEFVTYKKVDLGKGIFKGFSNYTIQYCENIDSVILFTIHPFSFQFISNN